MGANNFLIKDKAMFVTQIEYNIHCEYRSNTQIIKIENTATSSSGDLHYHQHIVLEKALKVDVVLISFDYRWRLINLMNFSILQIRKNRNFPSLNRLAPVRHSFCDSTSI